MTILITGGAGYIGAHMAWALHDRGEQAVVIDSLVTGFRTALPQSAQLIEADIADRDTLRAVFAQYAVTAIAHFAASTIVPDSVADPLRYYANNTIKAHALIEEAVRAGIARFVFSSTAAVYGSPGPGEITEETPPRPESPYGASKLATEGMLRDAANAHGFSLAILRYFNVAGADPLGRAGQSSARATHLIKVCAQAALGKRDGVEIFGTDYPTPDGTGVRDYIHVSDLIDAHLLALDHLPGSGQPILLNCGYGRGFSVREVIGAVQRVSGNPFLVREMPRRAGDPASVVAKADKIRASLGWKPRFADLDTIVEHALSWEKRLA
jgi:UDP-glucose 4-epimerase